MAKTHTSAEGWERIASVEPEVWRDPATNEITFATVWLVTTRGEVFAADLQKGETLEGVATHYRNRGWTDARAVFFKPTTEGMPR